MNKRLLLLSCIVATNAFAVEYWYDVNENDACSYRWCKSQPAAGTCCSSTNSVTKVPSANRDGYTLRGWTKSSVGDADGNAGQLFGFVAGANANLSDISVAGATTFRAAWAKNCKSSITGGTCELTIGDKGSVLYTANADNGYKCDSHL